MKKILVIGCPGSRKTTFALKLAEKLNIPCVHLDKLFWKSGWVECSQQEFDYLLDEELKKRILDNGWKLQPYIIQTS